MAYGVGGAIAQGLESGFQMGRQVDIDRAAAQERERTAARQAVIDERAAKAAELTQTHNELAASRERLGMLATEGSGLAQQYGGDVSKIPVDVQTEYATRTQAARRGHEALLNKLAPAAQDWRQSAQDDASKMQTGQLDPLDPKYPAARLVHTLTATARRPLQDFMPQGDQPAPVTQMVNDFRTGLQTQNEGLTLKAINGLFAPELKTGVGQPSPHGGVIVGKQVVKLLPAPSDPNNPNDPNAGKVTPVLRVFVREGPDSQAGVGETQRMASVEQQQYGAPPGATGHYDAPVTQNRSTDPNDPIAHISMEDAMNRVGQMETLTHGLSDPALRAKVEQGMQEAGAAPNTFLQSLYSVGGKMPTKQETYENIPIGPRGTLRVTKNAQGVETRREMLNPPPGTEKTGPLGQKLKDIEKAGLTPEETAKAKRVATGLEKVKAGGGALTGKSSALGGIAAPTKPDETVEFWARAVIAGDKDWQTGLSRGKGGAALIEAVKKRVPALAKEMNLEPQDIGTTRAMNAALGATLKDLTKRSEAVDLFASKVEKDMATFEAELAKPSTWNTPEGINTPFNVLRRKSSDPDLARLDLAAKQVGTEYERLITGGTLSVAQLHTGAAEDAKKLVNGDMPPKKAREIMDLMRTEMKNAREAAHESRTRVQDQLRELGRAAAPAKVPAVSADDEALINKYLKK